MKGKKWLAGVLALSSLLCGAGCGDGESDAQLPSLEVTKGMPDYSNEKGVLMIDCWLAPSMSDVAYQDFVDCGYNMMHLSNTSVHVEGVGANYDALNEDLDTHFTLAEKYGVKVILSMNARNSNQASATPFAWVQTKLGETLDKWKDSDTFYGYMPNDEPRLVQGYTAQDESKMQRDYERCIDYIRDEYIWWSQNYPGKAFEVVLLPAPMEAGATVQYGHGDSKKDIFDGDHEAYLDYYYDNFLQYVPYEDRIWSFDAYPYGKTRDGIIYRERYIGSLDAYAYRSEKDNAAKWTYMQNENNIFGLSGVTQQYYTAMAFGYEHFVTYTYNNEASWGLEQTCLDPNGLKTDNYYYYQKTHKEIRSFENVYMAFTDNWIGALTSRGTEAANEKTVWRTAAHLLDGYYRLDKVTSTQDTLIGVFRDGKGYDGFIISDQVLPTENVRNTVELTFNQANKAIVYQNGKPAEVRDLENGKLTIQLKTGGGAFVIPVMEE